MRIGLFDVGPALDGEFDVIVADPPWRSDFGRTDSRSAERHYPTMPLADIRALQVPAAADSLLFLWVPASMIPSGLQVMRAWGFSFRSSAVWVKDRIGVGHWFRSQHELLLLGRKGRFREPLRGTQPSSVFMHRRLPQHSQKPETVQDAIEATYPGLRYLELFARRERPGWTVWGLEAHQAPDTEGWKHMSREQRRARSASGDWSRESCSSEAEMPVAATSAGRETP